MVSKSAGEKEFAHLRVFVPPLPCVLNSQGNTLGLIGAWDKLPFRLDAWWFDFGTMLLVENSNPPAARKACHWKPLTCGGSGKRSTEGGYVRIRSCDRPKRNRGGISRPCKGFSELL